MERLNIKIPTYTILSMKSRIYYSTIAILAILVMFSSCYSKNRIVKVYDPQEQNTASLAFIERGNLPDTHSQEEYVLVYQVDSIKVAEGTHAIAPKRCEILPGRHTIEVFHRKRVAPYILGRYLVTFEAEAGKTYSIKAETDQIKREVDISVIDINSGERIKSTASYRFVLRDKK